jgi:hypothetical protein
MTSKIGPLKRSKPDYAMLFFVLLATAVGGYIRISQAFSAGFPINDGGLFYSMTRDIQANGFHLPFFTSYNNIQIPLVYPPLALYISGLLSSVTGWSLIKIYQILPSVIASLSIPAFYLLARDLIKSKSKTALATLLFALIPGGFYWLVMGGGITRSFGFLFYLLTLWSSYRMYSTQKKIYIFSTALLGALTCLSHPESAVHTVACAILFVILFSRNKRGFIVSGITVLLVLLLTAPWWVTILTRHGIGPILAAGASGGYNWSILLGYLQGNLAQEAFLTFLGCFTVVGLLYEIAKKRYFLPLWFVIAIISEPRSGPLYFTPVIAICSTIVLVDLIFASLRPTEKIISVPENPSNWADEFLVGRAVKISLAFLLAYLIMSSLAVSYQENQTLIIRQGDLEAFQWINNNLPSRQSFLVITGENPLQDPTSEWFPALTLQTSITTVQGHEWLSNPDFNSFQKQSADLQLCTVQNITCLNKWEKDSGADVDYLFFRKWKIQDNNGTKYINWPLEQSLMDSGLYQNIYETETTAILLVKK